MVYITIVTLGSTNWEIAATDRGICGIRPQTTFAQAPENTFTQMAAQQLQSYWEGRLQTFALPLDVQGTPFQQAVWSALQAIPYGQFLCYSQVAQLIGRPRAVRAVAHAIGQNPCLILIPCHRVLGKDGSLTGFSGGLDLKRQLLQLERIPYLNC